MKKIKKKLLQIMLYTVCWRNVDRLNNIWIYDSYYIELKKERRRKMEDQKIYTKEDVYKKIQQIKDYYEEKLKEKPNAIQMTLLGIDCFTLGFSIATLISVILK